MKSYLYVFDTLADWEIGFLIAELQSGRYFRKLNDNVTVVTVGDSTGVITTMGGLKIRPDMALSDMKLLRDDLLILPGGDTWMESVHDPVLKIAERCLGENILVAAICGATIALAGKGLLNSIDHTSNNLRYLKTVCPGYTGERFYREEGAVIGGNCITASGIAPVEFAYQTLKKLDLFFPETLRWWYELYRTRETKYFYNLMESLKVRER